MARPDLSEGAVVISRRRARRQAIFLLYQWDLAGGETELGAQYAGEIDPWARALAEEAAARAPELDERITAAAEGWTADRLGAVERNALRAAIHELDRGEVPAEVAIDEAVGFAKRYATEDAGRLVNGILGRIQREQAATARASNRRLARERRTGGWLVSVQPEVGS